MLRKSSKIGITGATGYLGGVLGRFLSLRGWDLVALSRRQPTSAFWQEWRPFSLGGKTTPELFDGLDAVIHCAWDFKTPSTRSACQTNHAGSLQLLQALQARQRRRSVFISSASAFEGCRSIYGKTKLALEKEFLREAALVIRPGLIFSDEPGGTYGGLVRFVNVSPFLPNITGSPCLQRMVHAEDVASALASFLETSRDAPKEPVFLAHPKDVPFRDLLRHLAISQGKAPIMLPIPWPLLWLILRMAEILGKPIGFRSDSLLGLVFYNPNPDYEPAKKLGWNCRPYFPATQDGRSNTVMAS